MRKYLLLFLLLEAVFCLGYEGWLQVGEAVEVDEVTYVLRAADAEGRSVILTTESPEMTLVVQLSQPIAHGKYTFAFLERKDLNIEEYAKYNITGIHGVPANYSYHVSIEKIKPPVKLTRSISPTAFAYRDNVNLTIEIENSGTEMIRGRYFEELPLIYRAVGELQVTVGGVTKGYGSNDARSVQWIGSLKGGEKITLFQVIQLAGMTSSNRIGLNNGTFAYELFGESYEVQASVPEPKYRLPVIVSGSFTESSVSVGSKVGLDISLESKVGELLTPHLEILPSHHLKVVSAPGLAQKGSALAWDGRLAANARQDFSLEFQALKSGNATVEVALGYKYRNLDLTDMSVFQVASAINRPVVQFSVPASVTGHDQVTVRYGLDNNATGVDYKEVRLSISSELFENEHFLFQSLVDGEQIAKETSFQAPWVDADTKFPINISCTYSSTYNESFTDELLKSLDVKKVNFVPAVRVVLHSNNYTAGENGSEFDVLVLVSNITMDGPVESAQVSTEVFQIVDTLSPMPDTEQYVQSFRVPNGSLKKELPVSYRIKYVQNGSAYYVSERVVLADPTVAQTRVTHAGSYNFTKDNPLDYIKPRAAAGELKGFAPQNTEQVVAVVVMFMGTFFLVVFIFIAMKRRKGETSRDSAAFGAFKKVAGTEHLETINRPVAGPFQTDSVPLPTSNLDVLEGYISMSLKSGRSKDQVRSELLSKGWLKDIVEVYLK